MATKRTHDQVVADGYRWVRETAQEIRKRGEGRVTISEMASRFRISRTAFKHGLSVWKKEARPSDLRDDDWLVVEHWLKHLHMPMAKRVAYAELTKELIESAPMYGISNFEELAELLGVHRQPLANWYERHCGPERPMIVPQKRPERAMLKAAEQLGADDIVIALQEVEKKRIDALQDLLRPRVEEIESIAA